MAMFRGPEQRRAARIRFRQVDNIEVRYKFLSHLDDFQCDRIFRGSISNLSKGGALFTGPIPDSSWLPKLGTGQVLIGMNVMIPDGRPIKCLASLRWTRPGEFVPDGEGSYELGVQFEQLEPEHRNALSKFLIGYQIRTRKFRRERLEDI
ncbi:PilZ domain-containing protein [Planctomycetota bacterium]|nr:PilZ domain-containing protein [Planctomycetota bacterium]